jgi:hypothetical protein
MEPIIEAEQKYGDMKWTFNNEASVSVVEGFSGSCNGAQQKEQVTVPPHSCVQVNLICTTTRVKWTTRKCPKPTAKTVLAATTARTVTSPAMPSAYSLTLTWSMETPTNTQHFKHMRWYDLDAQKYRDDQISTSNNELTDQVIELPSSEHKKYDHNILTSTCREQPDESRIDGFVPILTDATVEDDTVRGIAATKYTKKFAQYTKSVWFSKDKHVPLQVYDSYMEEQKASIGGIIRISSYSPEVADIAFGLPGACKHPITPEPTGPPTAPPKSQKHWIRDWTRTDCGCQQVEWTGIYLTEATCISTECKPTKVAGVSNSLLSLY